MCMQDKVMDLHMYVRTNGQGNTICHVHIRDEKNKKMLYCLTQIGDNCLTSKGVNHMLHEVFAVKSVTQLRKLDLGVSCMVFILADYT